MSIFSFLSPQTRNNEAWIPYRPSQQQSGDDNIKPHHCRLLLPHCSELGTSFIPLMPLHAHGRMLAFIEPVGELQHVRWGKTRRDGPARFTVPHPRLQRELVPGAEKPVDESIPAVSCCYYCYYCCCLRAKKYKLWFLIMIRYE